MLLLTLNSVIVCKHKLGRISTIASQQFVCIDERPVLVATDPEQRPISGCPNYGPTIKPCTTTLKVRQGYSEWLRIDGRAVCLDAVKGYTDGTPPGIVDYEVDAAGQSWVRQR